MARCFAANPSATAMWWAPLAPLISMAALLLLLPSRAEAALGPVTACYFTNWARYRGGLINQGKDVFEMGLPGDLCSHVMYGFAKVTADYQLVSNDPNADHPSGHAAQDQLCPAACNDPAFKPDWNDPAGQRCDWPCSPTRVYRGYEGLTVGLKRKNPAVKAIVSVGGWNFNDCAASSTATYGQGDATCELFSTIAASEATSRAFARNVIAFCRKWGFDGFDIDWEYPVIEGHNSNQKVSGQFVSTPQDYSNYIRLLRILKEEFALEKPASPLLLTAAVGVGKDTADRAYDVPGMSLHLDLINLMTYDLHGAWESRTGCNANLYATQEDTNLGGGVGAGLAVQGYPLSVSWAVDYWLQRGAPAAKLTMGLGTYGRGWKLASPSAAGYNAATTGASTPGLSTKEAGYLAFYEIQELLRSGQATRFYDEQRQCPYVVTTAGEWIGYDDEQSYRAKLDFAATRGLAGTMLWALDLDDFAGAYGSKVPYPLVSLARRGSGLASSSQAPASTTAVPASPTASTSTSTVVTTAARTTTSTARTTTSTVPTTTSTAPTTTSTARTTTSGTTSGTASTVRTTTLATGTTSTARTTTLATGTTTRSSTLAASTAAPPTSTSTRAATTTAASTTTSRLPTSSTNGPATTTMRATTTAAAPSTTAGAGKCVRNPDCAVNAWCQDTAYDSWCALNGQAGYCPAPQCLQNPAGLAAFAVTTTSASLSTTRSSTTAQSSPNVCSRNLDCTVNAWCQDTAYDAWCASNGQAGFCPAPQCLLANSPSTTSSSSTTSSPRITSSPSTTRSAASTSLSGTASPSSTSRPPTTSSSPSTSSSTMAATTTTTMAQPSTTRASSTTRAASTTSLASTSSSAFLSTTRASSSSSSSSSPSSSASPTSSWTTRSMTPSTTTRSMTPSTTTAPRTTTSGQAAGPVDAVLGALRASNPTGVFMYDTGAGWIQSSLYTWPDMIEAVRLMATQGVGSAKFWLGDAGSSRTTYGLVNVAAFLAQSMQETIQYNACDENNWSDAAVAAEAGGAVYTAAAACGQLSQSYQDYTCSAEEDAAAGGRMACEVDLQMEQRASTQASWYGAPPKLFCAPRSKVPKAPRWDYASPWCAPEGGWGYVAPFPASVDLPTYFQYVNAGGSCKDYQGIKTGGWTYSGAGCQDAGCPNAAAPLFGKPARTDVEGCCWWGRGVIQTTGVCNFGKLNYYLGKRAASEGRSALYPSIDFCRNPGAICEAGSPPELKWVAGLFYWVNAVQPYASGGWNYLAELKSWVDRGLPATDYSFIDGASGIVNRGCHNPPACGTGELHGGANRRANFEKVLQAMGLRP